MDWEYNSYAIEGFLFCLYFLKVSAERAYHDLLKVTKREERCLECVKFLFNWIAEGNYDLQAEDVEHQRSKGFLFCLYLRKMSPEDAQLELKKAGGNFNLDDVSIMFKRMESGIYSMQQKVISENPKEAFEILPDDIKIKVIEYLNLEARLTFRKTCHKNRELVDNGMFYIRDVMIHDSRRMLYILASDFAINWGRRGNEWSMNKVFKSSVPLPGTNETEVHSKFLEEVSVIFNSNKKLKIGKMDIFVTFPDSAAPEHFTVPPTNRVQMSFDSLKVTTLNLGGFSIEPLLNLMKICDPAILKHVTLRSNFVGRPVMKFRKRKNAYERFYTLEQWKNLKTFVDKDGSHICENLASTFAHLVDADVNLYSDPPLEQILELKEKLLSNPNLIRMTLHFNFSEEKFEELCDHFGTYNTPQNGNPSWLKYYYPDSKGVLSLCVKANKILFFGPGFVGDCDDVFQLEYRRRIEPEPDTSDDEESDDGNEPEAPDQNGSKNEKAFVNENVEHQSENKVEDEERVEEKEKCFK